MTLNIAVCDDDFQQLNLLKSYLISYQMNYNVDFCVTYFNSGTELVNSLSSNNYHVIFLDVEMPKYNGIEIAKMVRDLTGDFIKLVFISNYPQYMQQSFDVQAYHYLQKPLSYPTFETILSKLMSYYEGSTITKLLIKEDGGEELVLLNSILYIKTQKSKKGRLDFVLTDKILHAKGYLSDYEAELNAHKFVNPFRGYLVNLDYIRYFKPDCLIMSNQDSIPLSRRKEKEIRALFNSHIIKINNY